MHLQCLISRKLFCPAYVYQFDSLLWARCHAQATGMALIRIGCVGDQASMNTVLYFCEERKLFVVRRFNRLNFENVVGTNDYASVFPLASTEIHNWDNSAGGTIRVETFMCIHVSPLPFDFSGVFFLRTVQGLFSAYPVFARFARRRRGPHDSRNIQKDERQTSYGG